MSSGNEMVTCSKCGREWIPSLALDAFDIDGKMLCEPCAMPYLMGNREPESVDEERVIGICKRGQGSATCAFLVLSQKYACAKHSHLEDLLRARLATGQMGARGDNCSGPPAFVLRVQ